MCRKYHPDNPQEFINSINSKDQHITMGSAVVVESDFPYDEDWEWPSGDDMFYFSVCYSF